MQASDKKPSDDIDSLRRENEALRAEVDFLRNSLRMRGASLVAETLSSPRAIMAAPQRFWRFFREVRAVKLWRQVVLGLECGLPDDPLRAMTPDEKSLPFLRDIAGAVLSGQMSEAAPPAAKSATIAAALDRAAELEKLAAAGPDWPEAGAPALTPASPRKVAMALHTCEADVINGYTRRSHELIRALGREGWDVAGAVRGVGAAVSTPDGCRYARIGAVEPDSHGYEAYVAAYAARLYAHLEQSRPALVHAASNHVTGRAAALAARRAKLPFIYEVRGLWEVTRISIEPSYEGSLGFKAQRRLEIETARQADRLFVNGDAIAAYFAEAGIDENKIVAVPNGCDTDSFKTDPSDLQQLKKRWGLNGDPVIGFVGSITAYEGLEGLFAALAGLKETPFQILMVGDGSARGPLEAQARTLGLADRLCWAGRVSPEEARASYGLIDIAPLVRSDTPVTRLTPPLKPLDAMAAGAAMILSDLPPLREFAQDGRGLIVPPDDAGALRKALQMLLADPDKRRSMTEAARQWVRANRRWEHIAQTIGKSYEAVLA